MAPAGTADLMMDEQLELALRTNHAYTGLRGFEPDSKLFVYIPHSLARRERVIPLVLIGDTLKVAADRVDPDLSLVERRFPALTVDIVLASSRELDAVLAQIGNES